MVRRTLGFVLAMLLGLTLLWRGLEWYNGHLRDLASPPPPEVRSTATPSQPPPPTPPTPSPIPLPSRHEIDAIDSADPPTQAHAVETLRSRVITPELIAAVKAAQPHSVSAAEGLLCLRARFPGREAIELAIANLPTDSIWPDRMDLTVCLLEALADRTADDPDRILDALIPFSQSYVSRPRVPALRGLGKITVSSLPKSLESWFENAVSPSLPIGAAFALGAPRHSPERIQEWLQDKRYSYAVCVQLENSDDPAAARIVARILATELQFPERRDLFDRRESKHHDATQALADLALDSTQPLRARQRALEILGSRGDPAIVGQIQQLENAQDPMLGGFARAASAELRRRSGR